MMSCISHGTGKAVLDALHQDAARGMGGPRPAADRAMDERQRFHELRYAYMAIEPEFGHLLYSLVRTSNARHIVEFGTSMGVSTIYLAAGLKDADGGKLITTEYEPEKVERARKNLTDAGLEQLVDFRAGDALESLKTNLPASIDFVFLDGAKSMYLDVLRLVEPRLRPGAIVASDNTDHDGVEPFLAYLRDAANGYVTSAVLTMRGGRPSGHEISVRV